MHISSAVIHLKKVTRTSKNDTIFLTQQKQASEIFFSSCCPQLLVFQRIFLFWSSLVFFIFNLCRRNKQLGHSGKLYQNNLIAYDRATHSLWSQLLRLTVAGVARGEKLTMEHSSLTKWSTWKKLYPNTRVLARPSGSRRNYFQDPYKHYRQEDRIMFPSCFAYACFLPPPKRKTNPTRGSRDFTLRRDNYRSIPYSLKKSKELTLVVFTPMDAPILFPYSEVVRPVFGSSRFEQQQQRNLTMYGISG